MKERIKKYRRNAYLVYSGQKENRIVGAVQNSIEVASRNIVVWQRFFTKIGLSHGEILKDTLFNFVETLNDPDEIHRRDGDRFNYFKTIGNSVNVVAVGKDTCGDHMNLITSFYVHLSSKNKLDYIQRLKKTSELVFFRKSRKDAPDPFI